MDIKAMGLISIAVLILFAMHYALFQSMICFFAVTRPWIKALLYTAMGVLTIAFLTAFLLLQWHESPWTIGYFVFAGTWMGILIHLIVAVGLIWAAIGLARLTGSGLNSKMAAGAVLSITVLVCLYGIHNAFHPRVREIDVSLPNLPPQWQGRTIVHLSDTHLGHVHNVEFTRRIVSRINALSPDVIVITGDLFDGMGGPFEHIVKPLNRLRAKNGVLFVTGNHEHYAGIDRAMAAIQQTSFQVLDNECIPMDGLDIIGVSYPGIEKASDIRNLPVTGAGTTRAPRILLFHTPTNLRRNTADAMQQHFSTYWMPDTRFAFNKELGIDLQLSGHTHHGQIFPLNLLTGLLYGGHDYGLSRNGNFRLYTTCGAGTWAAPMRTVGHSEIVEITLKADGPSPVSTADSFPCKSGDKPLL
ncbi:MAG: metallophosphoesterase [Thermodesulfobacteriota bacterium]